MRKKIKYIQSNNGRDFVSRISDQFLKKNGTVRRLSVVYNQKQNEMTERKNRTLLEIAMCLLTQSDFIFLGRSNFSRRPQKVMTDERRLNFGQEKRHICHLLDFKSIVLPLNSKRKFEERKREGVFRGKS